ncbi:hypothetical protein AX15_005269 [Amanita polypyramis BW_CC]|nr:hypothetical protein AX15_005269 [Amanita polypyramis BW_CC]
MATAGTLKYPKIQGYELVQQIGGGGFSTVFRAANISDHRVAACKLIQLTPKTTEKERKTIEKEIRIHAALKHDNVLQFVTAAVVEPDGKHNYVPGIYIMLELAAGGDLFDKIAPDVGVGDDIAHFYFNQLLSGMDYIHNQGVCHRDLKPENLLLNVAGTLKISDFGLSAVYKLKETGRTRMLSEKCGSLPYVAPELNTDEPYQAEPIDVWGMGVILFTLLGGNTPWDEPTRRSPEFRRYLSGDVFGDAPWNRMSEMAICEYNVLESPDWRWAYFLGKAIICGMLAVDPQERMSIADIYQHPWCSRPSQLANESPFTLADKLTQSLRQNGDLELASPDLQQKEESVDKDGDETMDSTSSHHSQFTQSLLLFSQTQHGTRYTPHLTRFYTSIGPTLLMTFIQESLEALGVKCKPAPSREDPNGTVAYKLRIGGYDRRKIMFKGWVEVEAFSYRGHKGSFCVMQRDVGNPISWRQLWKALILSEAVEPHVLRKNKE